MQFQYNDGGRKEAGYKGTTGDCVCRAIAIATNKPYEEIYNTLNALAESEHTGKRKRKTSNSRTGVFRTTYEKYLLSQGWTWIPTMKIGQGCKIHLRDGELPNGTLIVRVSKHLTTVINQVIHDTHDPQRHGIIVENGITRPCGRCVYGYFMKGETNEN